MCVCVYVMHDGIYAYIHVCMWVSMFALKVGRSVGMSVGGWVGK